MAVRPRSDAETVPEQSVESSAAGVEWAAITAGALAAVIPSMEKGEVLGHEIVSGRLSWNESFHRLLLLRAPQ